jgi:two-component system CheB/CheR fusion protein
VTPERLARFFTREGDTFRIKREIRRMLIFASTSTGRSTG